MRHALRCEGLTVSFGGTKVLDGLDLEVAASETVALLGPSGSGKTTLLYAIAGLLEPDAGTIEIDGRHVGPEIGPEHRNLAMVFQNYALWPHLDARSTVGYPLERRGMPKAEARAKADELLELVGIGQLGNRLPGQLSGGEQQRVGLARALAAEPELFLFDEPTAHLDAAVRQALQQELVAQRARTGAAALYTTHDAAEAMAVADRVAVLRGGRIVQIGSPVEVYEEPVDEWVAALTGPASVVKCDLIAASDGMVDLQLGGQSITVPGRAACPSGPAILVLRPAWARLGGPIQGEVAVSRFEGPHTDLTVTIPGGTLAIRQLGWPPVVVGDTVGVEIERGWVVGITTDHESWAGSGSEPHE